MNMGIDDRTTTVVVTPAKPIEIAQRSNEWDLGLANHSQYPYRKSLMPTTSLRSSGKERNVSNCYGYGQF